MKWWKRLFGEPTEDEAFRNGRDFAFAEHDKCNSYAEWELVKEDLRDKASGGFNTKPHHKAFDRGVLETIANLEAGHP